MYGAHKPPSVMNFSLGIQQRVAGIVFDASYVGSLSRNTYYLYNINPIPIGAHFNPANFDPTQPPGTPLPTISCADIRATATSVCTITAPAPTTTLSRFR